MRPSSRSLIGLVLLVSTFGAFSPAAAAAGVCDALPVDDLTAEETPEGALLNWTAPVGTIYGEAVILAYRVTRINITTPPGQEFPIQVVGTVEEAVTEFVDETVGNGSRYVYFVTVIYDCLESPPSNPVFYPPCHPVHPGPLPTRLPPPEPTDPHTWYVFPECIVQTNGTIATEVQLPPPLEGRDPVLSVESLASRYGIENPYIAVGRLEEELP